MRTCPQCGESIEDQFDSCWKCAGAENPNPTVAPLSVTPSRLFLIVLMAIVCPLLADSIHSLMVSGPGTRHRFIELEQISQSAFWIWAGIRAIVTLLVIWPFRKSSFWSRLVWCGLLAIWFVSSPHVKVK